MFAVSTSPVNARNGSYMVCSSIVEYTEQAGVVVWRKMTARPFEYTTS